MNQAGSERAALEQASHDLQEKGYEVILEPSANIVPSFLGKYKPDIIAFKDDKPTIVIEIKRKSGTSDKYIKDIAKLFDGKEDYEFIVHWISSLDAGTLKLTTLDALVARGEELKQMHNAGLYVPSLLTCWAMLEGMARILYPDSMAKPQRPESVVQKLASEGNISISEATELRKLYKKRNNIIHGVLDEVVDKNDIEFFRTILLRGMYEVREVV